MIVFAAIAAGAGLALAGGVWTLGAKSQQPRRKPIEQHPAAPYEPVRFESGGVPIVGWLLKPPGAEPHPAVVVAHGWGSNRARVLRYAGPLHEAGFAVLLYDARSHGESGHMKAPSGFMFRDDLEAAVAWLAKQPAIDRDRIAVLGHSIGGFGALLAYGRELPVRAVVTDAAPLRFESMLESEVKRRKLPRWLGRLIAAVWFLRAGITRAEIRAVDVMSWLGANASNASKPLLLAHSLHDEVIPADDLSSLTARHPLRHVLLQGQGHSSSEQDPAFWEAVLPFLREHVLGEDKKMPEA